MNRKILMSVLALTVAIGLIGVGTYAVWTDSIEGSTGTFESGSLDLKVNGSDDPQVVMDFEDMKPGDVVSQEIELSNWGSLDGDLSFESSSDGGALSTVLQVSSLIIDGEEQIDLVYPTLGSLDMSTFDSIVLLGDETGGETKTIIIEVTMPDINGMGHMGESTTETFNFHLTQQ